MKPSEIRSWEPGDLVQIKRGVTGMGDIGFVIGPAGVDFWGNSNKCLNVLFGNGIRKIHSNNLQTLSDDKHIMPN